jgi:hypothetical protein
VTDCRIAPVLLALKDPLAKTVGPVTGVVTDHRLSILRQSVMRVGDSPLLLGSPTTPVPQT